MLAKIFIGVLIGGAIGAVMGYYGKCTSGACPLTANPYRGAVYGAVVAALLAVSLGAGSGAVPTGTTQSTDNQEATSMAAEITSVSEFEEKVMNNAGVVLVDFFSHGCPPCRALLPIVSELATKYEGRAGIYKVDVEKNMELAQQWGIQKIPAVVILKDGKEVERKIGLHSESQYAEVLDKLLAEEQ